MAVDDDSKEEAEDSEYLGLVSAGADDVVYDSFVAEVVSWDHPYGVAADGVVDECSLVLGDVVGYDVGRAGDLALEHWDRD